jgi:molybdopterin synthase sulfur carrier subunit
MKVEVLFFGSLTEHTGISSTTLENVRDTRQLLAALESRWPGLTERTHRLALNQSFVKGEEVSLKDGDEVAVMPPFAGG